jgi:hypothetical protein
LPSSGRACHTDLKACTQKLYQFAINVDALDLQVAKDASGLASDKHEHNDTKSRTGLVMVGQRCWEYKAGGRGIAGSIYVRAISPTAPLADQEKRYTFLEDRIMAPLADYLEAAIRRVPVVKEVFEVFNRLPHVRASIAPVTRPASLVKLAAISVDYQSGPHVDQGNGPNGWEVIAWRVVPDSLETGLAAAVSGEPAHPAALSSFQAFFSVSQPGAAQRVVKTCFHVKDQRLSGVTTGVWHTTSAGSAPLGAKVLGFAALVQPKLWMEQSRTANGAAWVHHCARAAALGQRPEITSSLYECTAVKGAGVQAPAVRAVRKRDRHGAPKPTRNATRLQAVARNLASQASETQVREPHGPWSGVVCVEPCRKRAVLSATRRSSLLRESAICCCIALSERRLHSV